MDKTSLKSGSFKPTPLMTKWVNEGFRINSTSPTDIARSLGKRRSVYYEWLKVEGFSAWWNDEFDKYYSIQKMQLMEICFYRAEKGDYEYWREAMDILKSMETVNP